MSSCVGAKPAELIARARVSVSRRRILWKRFAVQDGKRATAAWRGVIADRGALWKDRGQGLKARTRSLAVFR